MSAYRFDVRRLLIASRLPRVACGSPRSGRVAATGGIAALGAAIVTVAGTGVAYASWSASGAGAGSEAASSLQLSVQAIVAGDDPTNPLSPGQTADAVVKVSNPNS